MNIMRSVIICLNYQPELKAAVLTRLMAYRAKKVSADRDNMSGPPFLPISLQVV